MKSTIFAVNTIDCHVIRGLIAFTTKCLDCQQCIFPFFFFFFKFSTFAKIDLFNNTVNMLDKICIKIFCHEKNRF